MPRGFTSENGGLSKTLLFHPAIIFLFESADDGDDDLSSCRYQDIFRSPEPRDTSKCLCPEVAVADSIFIPRCISFISISFFMPVVKVRIS